MTPPTVQAAVKGLIVKNGKFLMLQQKAKNKVWWDLPGGRIKYGEDPVEGLKREILEETKLEVEVGKPVGVWHFFWDDDKTQVVCITFVCDPKTEDINLNNNPDSDENLISHHWFTFQDFMKNSKEALLDEGLKKIITNYFEK